MPTLKENLDHIREVMDMAIADDIDSIRGKGQSVAGVLGLSAECKALAKKDLEKAKVVAYQSLNEKELKLGPMILMKIIDAKCADEQELFTYADRLNAGLTHQLEYLRSLFSYAKQELIEESNAARSNFNT